MSTQTPRIPPLLLHRASNTRWRWPSTKAKWNATRVWGCSKCGKETQPVTDAKKASRTCPHCGNVAALRCFDSKSEFKRLNELLLLQKFGDIRNLEVQPVYPIIVEGTRICEYRADFRYFRGNSVVAEDAKGVETPIYKLKRKLVEALYPGTKIVHP